MSANERAAAVALSKEGDRHLEGGRLDQAGEAFNKALAAFEGILARPGSECTVVMGCGTYCDTCRVTGRRGGGEEQLC
jgi:hypothetical protein